MSSMRIAFTALLYLGAIFKAFLAFENTSPGSQKPVFINTDDNTTTIVAGNTAILRCKVDNLNSHAVVWTNPKEIVLSKMINRIIDDPRMSIERQSKSDWDLFIRNVKYKDRGTYKCIVNTNPPSIYYVKLDVLVPSTIDDATSSKDITIREGQTVELVCNASGIPTPSIQWYREYDVLNGRIKEAIVDPGEILIIHNISRTCEGTYICEAFNNVENAVSREIKVTVVFPPEVRVLSKRLGQYIGKETVLQCECSGSPKSICLWRRDGKEIETASSDYRLNTYEDNPHTITLSLTIHRISQDDFGKYVCYASNMFGEDWETMILYEYSLPTTSRKPQKPIIPTTHMANVGLELLEEAETSTKYVIRIHDKSNNFRKMNSYQKNEACALKSERLCHSFIAVIVHIIMLQFLFFN